MSNYDILTLQSETASHISNLRLKNRIPKLFLSMVWEGVLKAELDFFIVDATILILGR
jgi:hypothetical protein